jgi:phosphatidylglycerophosphate synthase
VVRPGARSARGLTAPLPVPRDFDAPRRDRPGCRNPWRTSCRKQHVMAAPTPTQYRFRDLLNLPGMAAAFPLLLERPAAALAVLVIAGATDLLDGWVARRYGLVTATGAALDGVTDKLFIMTVAVTLVVSGRLPLEVVLLLSTREIGEAPLVAWFVLSPRARARRAEHPSANALGKIATTLQFVTVAMAIARATAFGPLVIATAVAGAVAAISYWIRAFDGLGPRGRDERSVR